MDLRTTLFLNLLAMCFCCDAFSAPKHDLPDRFFSDKMIAANATSVEVIKGVVVDEDRQPLVGATVSIRSTSSGTITDVEGRFTINANVGDTLSVSFVGYATREILVDNQTTLTVQLSPDSKQLEDIVVVAYGTQKRSDITGSIASANVEDFNKGVVVNPGQLLQG